MQESDRLAEDEWTQAEVSNENTIRQNELRQELDNKINPKRTMIHKFFLFISCMVTIGSILMLIGQILGLLFQSNTGIVEYILRIYTILLCVVTILIEWEIKPFGKESKIVHLWISRGLFYSFIGILGFIQIDTSQNENTTSNWFNPVHHYFWVVAWIMLISGILYFIMGILCIQLLHNKLQRDYQERLNRAPEIQRTVTLSQTVGTS